MLSDLLDRPVREPVSTLRRGDPEPDRWGRAGGLRRRHLVPAPGLLILLALATVLQLVHLEGPRRTPAEAAVAARVQELLVGGRWPAAEVGVLAWLPVAGWVALTGAATRYDSVVVAGREAMLVPVLATVLLVWLLARALCLSRAGATLAAMLLLVLPPAVQLHRSLEPDLVAVPLVLTAGLLAVTSGRRGPASAPAAGGVGAGCLALAVLVQPAMAVVVPLWAWTLWRRGGRSRRPAAVLTVGVLLVLLLAAALAGGTRAPLLVLPAREQVAGSLVDALAGLLLPASALVLAAVAARVWRSAGAGRGGRRRSRRGLLVVVAVVAAGVTALPGAVPLPGVGDRGWWVRLAEVGRTDGDSAQRQAQTWVEQHIDRDQRLLGDGALGPDLVAAGFPSRNLVGVDDLSDRPPSPSGTSSTRSPVGWRQVDHVVLTEVLRSGAATRPGAQTALEQSSPLAGFGSGAARVEIRRVHPGGVAEAERQDRADQRARVAAGAELVRNPAVELDDATAAVVRAGRADARLMIGLSRLGALGTVTVADLPRVTGEAEAQVPRRQVLLTRLAGRDLPADRSAVEQITVRLAEQTPDYAPRSVRTVPGGLLVTWGVDVPSGLLGAGP